MHAFFEGLTGPDRPLRVLVVTGGHRYDEAAFGAMMDELGDEHHWVWATARQPCAQRWFNPTLAGAWDVILCHDVAGLHLERGEEPVAVGPTSQQAAAIVGMLDAGQPLVVLHHAVASWPAWEGWAEAIGARFHYGPGVLRGRPRRGSGYRYGTFPLVIADKEHPIAKGLGDFELEDELYHFDVLTDVVHPVAFWATDFSGELFTYTYDEVCQGIPSGATCEPDGIGPDLAAWTTTAGASPIAVLTPGDGPAAFVHPGFRQLLTNSILWAASGRARSHARSHRRRIDPSVNPPVQAPA